jgi:uncharacterized protein (TIGR03032 family)
LHCRLNQRLLSRLALAFGGVAFGGVGDGGDAHELDMDEAEAKRQPKPDGTLKAAADGKSQSASPASTKISVSRGFADWLRTNRVSIVFTSYQTGQLFLIGVMPGGQVSFHQRSFDRAMGVCARPERIYLGTHYQIWRLENVLAPGERANEHFDRLYIPRNAQTTGDVDVHELVVEPSGRIVFVNTKFSCLATTSLTHGFKPLWKPEFISRLAPEDRCHLNGLAMEDGKVRYVTAVSRSDLVDGWRERRHEGGVVIDVSNGRVVTEQLSMPHSPRVANGQLWVLDSGRGQVSRVDGSTGKLDPVAFCPGFLRGLAIWQNFAVVGLSLPRDGSFAGLELEDTLKARDGEAWCGLQIVDLRNGDIVQWLRLSGHVRELFDVTILPSVACPMAVGQHGNEINSTVTYEAQWGSL